ncbi:MAG: hypothetical protein AVDCRST_MAG93-7693, partial [uncultured Chloroflexia bacterium]
MRGARWYRGLARGLKGRRAPPIPFFDLRECAWSPVLGPRFQGDA